MNQTFFEKNSIKKNKIKIIQINIGNKCNQKCIHCHLECSPQGNKNMDRKTAELILDKLVQIRPETVELTGGAPEINENSIYFIDRLSKENINVTVRTNLTVLDLPEYSHFIDIYKKYGVRIIASLPSHREDETDSQRGKGVFKKSIKILKKLNEIGYGNDDRLKLDLVYNPTKGFIPDSRYLEDKYRRSLNNYYGINFDRLIVITNVPLGGFKKFLLSSNSYEDYMRLLVNNFNSETIDKLMCRKLISVDYEGFVYDCDFNLSLGMRIKNYEEKRFWEIDFDDFNPEISCGEHCYACTAMAGSSCYGSLVEEKGFDVKDTVKHYYGSELKKTSDLKTGACCNPDSIPEYIKNILPLIEPEVKERYYGCGSPIPPVLDGLKVLDLGCGTGLDCYVLSKLVGTEGHVYGIDMTKEQIEIAKKYVEIHAERFGFKQPNTTFIYDYIEYLGKNFDRESLDLVISNCVINLIEDKETVLRQVYEVLKYGGEFYFSDIYVDRRLPDHIRKDKILYGECLGGALYWKDFERLARKVGFNDPRVVSKRIVEIKNQEIQAKVENATFYSIVYRLWKIKELEDACEDYGHIAIYRGGIKESPFRFTLDSTHVFEKDKPERVCGNTALMLSKTRLKKYFDIIGDFNKHFGLFSACGTTVSSEKERGNSEGCSCC